MKSPPGKRVHWFIQSLEGQTFIAKGKTAFEAATNCGLKLSQCRDNIRWYDVRSESEEKLLKLHQELANSSK